MYQPGISNAYPLYIYIIGMYKRH